MREELDKKRELDQRVLNLQLDSDRRKLEEERRLQQVIKAPPVHFLKVEVQSPVLIQYIQYMRYSRLVTSVWTVTVIEYVEKPIRYICTYVHTYLHSCQVLCVRK
jgi:hypothetical protein